MSKVSKTNLSEEEYENSLECMIDTWNNFRNDIKDEEEDECTFAFYGLWGVKKKN